MDKYKKCAEFLRFSLNDNENVMSNDYKSFIFDGGCAKPYLGRTAGEIIGSFRTRWNYICDAISGPNKSGIFSYFKSCEYAEKIVKENNESFELRITQLEDMKHRITELEKENQKLKDLVHSSLEQINDMKISFEYSLRELEEDSLDNLGEQIISLLEHNKSLSSRVLDIESLFETKQVPNLIEM
jgi:hypothetical protein